MDSMGIDLASLPCRDMVPKNHENLGTIDQPRTRWDISRTWTSTSSLQWYLSLHISGHALSRHKLILLRQCHPWKKLFQNFQLICFPGNPRRHQECILSKIFFLVANRWYHMPTSHLTSAKQKRHQRLSFWYRKYLHVLFVFYHYYHIQDNLLQEMPFQYNLLIGDVLFVPSLRLYLVVSVISEDLLCLFVAGCGLIGGWRPIFQSEVWSCLG